MSPEAMVAMMAVMWSCVMWSTVEALWASFRGRALVAFAARAARSVMSMIWAKSSIDLGVDDVLELAERFGEDITFLVSERIVRAVWWAMKRGWWRWEVHLLAVERWWTMTMMMEVHLLAIKRWRTVWVMAKRWRR